MPRPNPFCPTTGVTLSFRYLQQSSRQGRRAGPSSSSRPAPGRDGRVPALALALFWPPSCIHWEMALLILPIPLVQFLALSQVEHPSENRVTSFILACPGALH